MRDCYSDLVNSGPGKSLAIFSWPNRTRGGTLPSGRRKGPRIICVAPSGPSDPDHLPAADPEHPTLDLLAESGCVV